MSTIVSTSFFIGDINIPNVSELPIAEKLNLFIGKYEPDCIQRILGYPLYKEYKENQTEARIRNIIEGGDYIDGNGISKRWNGFVEDSRYSLIAYYIYYFIQQSDATLTTANSTGVQNTEHGVTVSPQEKMVYAWNLFSEKTDYLIEFLWYSNINGLRVYPEFNSYYMQQAKKYCRKINTFGI